MSALSPEVRELLELIRTALDLPYGATSEDAHKRQQLRNDNAVRVIGHLNAILGDNPVPISTSVQVMRKNLAANPVNYVIKGGEAGRATVGDTSASTTVPVVLDDETYFTGVATAIEAAGFGVEFDFDAYDEPPGGVITLPDVTGYGLALIWNEGDGWTVGYPRYPGQVGVSCLRTLAHLGEYPVPSELVAVVHRVAAAGSADGEGRIR